MTAAEAYAVWRFSQGSVPLWVPAAVLVCIGFDQWARRMPLHVFGITGEYEIKVPEPLGYTRVRQYRGCETYLKQVERFLLNGKGLDYRQELEELCGIKEDDIKKRLSSGM